MNTIQYPIAFSLDDQKLVNAEDVKSGQQCNCICIECKQKMVAVNKKRNVQVPHFRHLPDQSCNGSFESYIHKVSKDVIKGLAYIMLPEIKLGDIPLDNHRRLYSREVGEKIASFKDRLYGIRVFQSPIKLEIDSIPEKEVVFHYRGHHKIRADIVIVKKGTPFLIEPFLTHKIDDQKRNYLRTLKLSCISIDLNRFIAEHGYLFKLEDLSNFLQFDLGSKNWENVREGKIKQMLKGTIVLLENALRTTDKEMEFEKEISAIAMKEEKLIKKRDTLEKEIRKLQNQIGELEEIIETNNYNALKSIVNKGEEIGLRINIAEK